MKSWDEIEHFRQIKKDMLFTPHSYTHTDSFMVKLPLLSPAQCDDLFSNKISRMKPVIEYLKNNLSMA